MARASDAAYKAIKGWIQAARFPPGSSIDEDEAARSLSMSRTPVREALLRLQSEGLVEIGRGKGIRVLPLSASDMRDIYQVISGIEVVAVQLLTRRAPSRGEMSGLVKATAEMQRALVAKKIDRWGEADEKFHRELMRLSGNSKLHAVGCQMRDFAKRAHMVAIRLQDDAYRAKSTSSHLALVSTILAGKEREASNYHLRQRQRGEKALVGVIKKFKLANL